MECFVCNRQAEPGHHIGDYIAVSCGACGVYRVSGTVVGQLERGRWLHTEITQRWLEEQRREGTQSPLISSSTAHWDGVWEKR